MPGDADSFAAVRQEIAANIRAERARARLSQQQVAGAMRERGYETWHYQTVGQIERGTRRIWADELIALADVLNTAPEILWQGKDRS